MPHEADTPAEEWQCPGYAPLWSRLPLIPWSRSLNSPCLYAGRKVSAKCVAQLTAFKMDRSKKINKDVPLGTPMSAIQLLTCLLRNSFALG